MELALSPNCFQKNIFGAPRPELVAELLAELLVELLAEHIAELLFELSGKLFS